MHGKFRLLSMSKASSHSTALPSLFGFFLLCGVFSCFSNPPNSDMDYRIFNVRTWSFLYVRIHMGVGHIDESAPHVFLGTLVCSPSLRYLKNKNLIPNSVIAELALRTRWLWLCWCKCVSECMQSTCMSVLRQFAALWAMVTMGTAPIKVFHYY